MSLIFDANQLCCDSEPLPRLPQAAFDYIFHAKLAADLTYRLRGVLIGHGGCARDHTQALRVDPAELSNDALRKSVADEFALHVASEILHRQDGDHDARRNRRSAAVSSPIKISR